MLTKREAVEGYIRAKKIQRAGGSTLHLGSRFWRFGSSSGAPSEEPVRAMYLWLETKFGADKAKIVANTVEELGGSFGEEEGREETKEDEGEGREEGKLSFYQDVNAQVGK